MRWRREDCRGARNARADTDLFESVFVTSVWLALTVLGVAFIVRFGSVIPWKDDGVHVQQLCANNTLTWQWLWQQVDVNRYPVTRLLMSAVFAFGGGDLRIQMLVSFAALSVATFVVIRGVRTIRGRHDYTDAVIPCLLLHLGHAECFLWFTLSHILFSTACYSVCVTYLFCAQWWSSSSLTGLAVICLALMPLQASIGMVLAIGLVPAYSFLAYARRHDLTKVLRCLLFAGVGISAMLMCGYLWNLDLSKDQNQKSIDVEGALTSALQAISISLGTISRRLWPVSISVIGFTIASLGMVAFRSSRRESRFSLTIGVSQAICLLTPLLLAGAIGWGRQSQGGSLDRYALYMAPLLVAAYVGFVSFGKGDFTRFCQIMLFSCALSALMFHMKHGLDFAQNRRQHAVAFNKDVAIGLPMTAIVARHAPFWGVNESAFRSVLESLRIREVLPFRNIAHDTESKAVKLDLPATSFRALEAVGPNTWAGSGPEARFQWDLPTTARCLAMRIEFELHTRKPGVTMQVAWKPIGMDDFQKEEWPIYFNPNKGRKREIVTFWIDGRISEFHWSPSRSGVFEVAIHSVKCLVAEDSP